jgi:DNA-directed RNA polymerase subunit RPC12/RpoP
MEERKIGKCANCSRLLYDVGPDDMTLPAAIECPGCHMTNEVNPWHRPIQADPVIVKPETKPRTVKTVKTIKKAKGK